MNPKHEKHEGNYTKENYKLFNASDKEKAFKTVRWKRPYYVQMNKDKNNSRLLTGDITILKTFEL